MLNLHLMPRETTYSLKLRARCGIHGIKAFHFNPYPGAGATLTKDGASQADPRTKAKTDIYEAIDVINLSRSSVPPGVAWLPGVRA